MGETTKREKEIEEERGGCNLITLKTIIERQYGEGVSSETVGEYKKSLLAFQREIENVRWTAEQKLGVKEETIKGIESEIKSEIALCDFYFELKKRSEQEANFGEWVFVKDFKRHENWNTPDMADCWVKTNGKIKAFIYVKKGTTTTRVWLGIENDTKHLNFYPHEYRVQSELNPSCLKNAESIEKKIKELKELAEKNFEEHQLPLYCKEQTRFNELKELVGGGGA